MSYTDIYNNQNASYPVGVDPNDFNQGMPTVNTQAAVANAGVASAPVPMGQNGLPNNGAAVPNVMGQGQGGQGNPGFFQQGGAGGFALGAIKVLGSLWNSFQQNKMAKQQFAFQKEAYQTNLKNQTQTYNTELQDRINARYVTEGRADVQGDVKNYVDKNKL